MITVRIYRGDVVDFLSEGYTSEQAEQNAEAYASELGKIMQRGLEIEQVVNVELVNDFVPDWNKFDGDYDENDLEEMYQWACNQLVNDWSWLPNYEEE